MPDWLASAGQLLFLAIGPLALGVGVVLCVRMKIDHGVGYLVALSLGAVVAIAELVSRYRDSPMAALASPSAAIYLTVNALASAGALYAIRLFTWTFGAEGQALPVVQVLVAGLGSAAVFRSSFFTVMAGDQNVAIGPNAVLSVILAAADRGVDRRQAAQRIRHAVRAVQGISFDQDADDLRRVAIATMQNLSAAEAEQVAKSISGLKSPQDKLLRDSTKALVLALTLQGLVGTNLLRSIISTVRSAAPAPSEPLSGQATTALDQLSRAGGSMPVSALHQTLQLRLTESAALLGDLQQRGLVTVQFVDGHEVVTSVTLPPDARAPAPTG